MLVGEPTKPGEPMWGEESSEVTVEGDRICLSGPLDADTVTDLRNALAEVSGREQVVVDLADVTRVPSAAVQALYAACRDADEDGRTLVLHAPAGTVAQHVLELVRLPYAVRLPARRGRPPKA
jgi:ABC-type transporter Mla MlaB component